MAKSNIHQKLKSIEEKYVRKDVPSFDVGDTVKMMVKVSEGDKVRLHPFEGIVIRKAGMGINTTFTVRKISFGEGVERIFPLHSPLIENLTIVSKASSEDRNFTICVAALVKRRVSKQNNPN